MKYSKLWGGLIGGLAGAGVSAAALLGYATCPDPNSTVDTCTLFGFSASQISAFVTLIASNVGVYFAPANKR